MYGLPGGHRESLPCSPEIITTLLIGYTPTQSKKVKIHQHESVTGRHMSFPSQTSLPSPFPSHSSRLSQITSFGFPASYSKSLLAIYFTYGNPYVSVLRSQGIPLSLSPTVTKSLFPISASPLLPCKEDHQYHPSRFHIYMVMCNIFFSTSDLLHSV